MSAQIVDPDRYKKTTRKKSNKQKEKIKKELKRKEKLDKRIKNEKIEKNSKNIFDYSYIKFSESKQRSSIRKKDRINKKIKIKNKDKKKAFPVVKVSVLIICIIGISILSKKIVSRYSKKSSEETVLANVKNEEKVSFVQDSTLTIGMSKLDTLDINKTKNIVLNELNRYSNISLISLKNNYEIEYKAAEKIEKLNNKEYLITLNKEYDVNIDDLKKSIENIKKYGKNNMYYDIISNVKEIVSIDKNTVKITLSKELPYFLYSLDFTISKNNTDKNSYILLSNTQNELKYSRNSSSSTVKDVIFRKYDDIDRLIEDFRSKKIDVFTASSSSIMSLIGKYDYSLKKYRDGKSLFLLGNSNSGLFKIKEVRKAILYSINRDKIIRDLNSNFIEKIDIPYIYSDIQYKYDVYGAQNALTSQGWSKSSGVYTKKIDGKQTKLEVSILVNSNDSNKVKVSELIKKMLEENGIKVNLKKYKDDEFNNCLKEKKFDMVLADVYVNSIPDISFIEEYLKASDIVKSAINIVKNSSVQELPKNVESLENIMSNEVACIGIYATNTNIVYQTNISGFSDTSYMNIFDGFKNIGKIQKAN